MPKEGPLAKRGWKVAAAGGLVSAVSLAVLARLVLPGGTFTGRFLVFLILAGLCGAMGAALLTRGRPDASRESVDDLLRRIASGSLDVGRDGKTRRVLESNPGLKRVLSSLQGVIGHLQDTGARVSEASSLISRKAQQMFADAGDQARAVGDVRRSLTSLEGEIERVVLGVDGLSGFTEKTSSAILEMRASIEEVVGATHNLSALVDEISASIEEMSRSIDEVAGHGESLSSFAIQNSSAMVQMDATIGQIEENIRETEGISRKVLDTAREGEKAVKQTVNALDSIHTVMSTNLEAMNALVERSRDIGKILKVIRDIADQTNLLALNAAIIAAQAGEHGRSFGVVAEEIRDLSERTTASTSEVAQIIETIQKDVGEASKVAEEGMARVQDGLRLGRSAEETLQRIAHAIEGAGTSISHIARAAAEQSKGSKQVTAAIEEMTKRIERISTATREQAETSRHIAKRSEVMKELTRNVDRAMEEEASGSNTIAEGMDQVRGAVEEIQKALVRMSQAGQRIVAAMDAISGAADQGLFGARELSATSASLKQESLLLVEELSSFVLPKPERGGELRLGHVFYAFNLDPAFANNIRDHEVVHPYCEGLLRQGHGTQVLPGLAESWHLSTDGRVYTFRLRPNLTFHNGRKVTSRDVLASWHRALSPKLQSESKIFLSWVEGVEEFLEGKAPAVRGVSAPDDLTVEIRLREPLAFFLYFLAYPEASILPPEAYDEATLRLKRPIGAGPYRVVEHGGDRVVMERFEGYWDPTAAHLDRLVFDYSSRDEESLTEALEAGRVHLASNLSNEAVESLLMDPFWQNNTESTVLLNTIFVSIRNDLPPYTSRELRQAMNYAIDREALVGRYVHARSTPARGVLPPGILAYRPDLQGYTYDPERARYLLQKGGFGSGVDLKVAVDQSRVRQAKEFAMIVEMLREVGIRVETETVSHEAFESLRKVQGKPGLYATGWYVDYPDPDSFMYTLFHSKGGDTLELHYHNPRFDEIVERARRSLDPEERVALYHEAEDILIEDAPCIFLYHIRGMVPHRPEVMGLKLYLTPPMVRPEKVWISRETGS